MFIYNVLPSSTVGLAHVLGIDSPLKLPPFSEIPGDYPDPGANKIGDHFYLVATGGGPKGAV